MQTRMNFNPCILDYFIIPENDDWIWELKAEKIKKDKQWEIIKNILEKNAKKITPEIYKN